MSYVSSPFSQWDFRKKNKLKSLKVLTIFFSLCSPVLPARCSLHGTRTALEGSLNIFKNPATSPRINRMYRRLAERGYTGHKIYWSPLQYQIGSGCFVIYPLSFPFLQIRYFVLYLICNESSFTIGTTTFVENWNNLVHLLSYDHLYTF